MPAVYFGKRHYLCIPKLHSYKDGESLFPSKRITTFNFQGILHYKHP